MSFLDDFWNRIDEDYRREQLIKWSGVSYEAYNQLAQRFIKAESGRLEAEENMGYFITLALDISHRFEDRASVEEIYQKLEGKL